MATRGRVGRAGAFTTLALTGDLPEDLDFDDPEVRRGLMMAAMQSAEPISDSRIPLDLARAMTAIRGMRIALATTTRMIVERGDATQMHFGGFDEAHDLLAAIVEGVHHPALREWERSPRRGDSKGISDNELFARLTILAVVEELASRPGTDGKARVGPSRARGRVAAALRGLAGYEGADGKRLENWRTTLAKACERYLAATAKIPPAKAKARAPRFITEEIAERRKALDMAGLRTDELPEFARMIAAERVPVARTILAHREDLENS